MNLSIILFYTSEANRSSAYGDSRYANRSYCYLVNCLAVFLEFEA